MSSFEPDEPQDICQAVRIGKEGKPAEVTIFYTPNKEFQIHNGYLAEEEVRRHYGRRYHRLKLVTSKGKILFVRRYNNGEFECESQGYWVKQRAVEL
ncbi:uncharacterized protein [Montipora capricornis]|uniref:uncharacterized protein isoform X3 n=1 Tax=Montipora capricornis TaxID=246305 RepID=UPI0035F18642